MAFARVMPCLAAAELSLDVAIPSGLLVLQPPDRMAALLEALIYEMLRGAQERLFLSVAEQDDLILVKVMNDARWAIPAAFAASLETLPDKARRCGATLSFEVVSEGCRLVMGLERYIPASNELTCQGLESTPVAEAALVPVCRVPQPAGWSVDPVIAPHAVRHAPGA
ncbi:MAG: hypothetical protein ACJ8AW_28330 [Rhodopila sp.]